MPARISRPIRRAVLGLLLSMPAVPVVGAVASPARAAPPACAAVTSGTVADFFDNTLPDRMRHDRVPGAVVSVVSGGSTVFAKGYGVADLERQVPFSESRSLVRIASITKLFTWTAVMQQVDAGRLDLHADVNRYLKDFTIPATYPQPVTLQNLMDHTAGFEDYIVATAAPTAADPSALGEYLAHHTPARIRPPGEISAYSNYGAALAGYIVAQVSGEPYDRYVQRHLFDPLGMTHSTATEPVPSRLGADLARSYNSDVNPPRPIPFMFDPMTPDGSVSATATDMANFMNAHLHAGRLGTNTILNPTTAARMHERSFAADPRLDGYAHGFKERTVNGHRVLMHDGGWEGFRSVLMLVPECDLGLFLSTNSTGGAGPAISESTDLFFDRFTPAPTASDGAAGSGPDASKSADTARAGFYQPTRHNESTVEKLGTLLGSSRLTVGADGTVHFKGKEWAPLGNHLYRAADGTDRLVFLTGAGGRRYVATDGPSYQLVARGETLPFNLLILLAVGLPALGALTLPAVRAVRRIRRQPTTTTTGWRAARILAAGSAVLGLAFLVTLTATLFADTDDFLYSVPLNFRVLLGVPVVALGAAAVATVFTVRAWRGSGAGIVGRAHQISLLVGMVVLAWFVWQWNLIGWQYR